IVEKSFSFKKLPNNEIKTSDFQFKGFYDDGTQRIPISGGTLLDRCFEAAIRKYSLFKGEENLNVFNNPDALNYLIETFSNIRQFEPYFTGEDNNQGFMDSAVELSRKAYERAMKADRQNSQQERELKAKMDLFRSKLSSTRQRLKTNRENANNYAIKLDELENSKEASTLLKGINQRLKSLNEKRAKAEGFINENYTINLLDDMWILCGFSSIFEEFQGKVSVFSKEKRKQEREEDKKSGKQELANEISKGIIPLSPNIPDKISMQEMINDEFCKVCGREAKQGSDAYIFMVNKLNELIKSQQPIEKEKEKALFPNNYLKELEQKSNNLEYDLDRINNLINTIKDSIEFNEARKVEVRKIQESIDLEEETKKKLLAQNDNLTEDQLQNAYENIRNWWDYRSQAEKQIVILEKDEIELVIQLDGVQREYDNLATNSVASTYGKVHTALRKILTAFEKAKEKNTQDFLLLLEAKANQYLEKLNIDGFYGIIRILKAPEGFARIVLQDKNDSFVVSPNQALKTTMYMSVLFAVSELTTIKRENDYPLIFDAPTSSFAPQKESDFFNVISDINKQCIIFTKSFLTNQGALDIDKINSLHCKIYRMEKKRPFNKLDLSTIQTILTPVK
ncbi:MAG: hypothetical protein Q8J97_12330, partial [Flavobacteriaceae bacterium]|nr:hypothetical protein [Flavobacteriaceae bacterium]